MFTRNEFNTLLAKRDTLIIDGALATELESRGLDLNHPLWSAKILMEDPGSIFKVHYDYFMTGADIAITSSYQASIPGIKEHLELDNHKAISLIRDSVQLAHQARKHAFRDGCSRRLLVAGSVGPYGAYLADCSEYRGDYDRTREQFQTFHRPRIQALVHGGVDLLAIETMPQLQEIEAVIDLLYDEFPGTIAWLSCTLRDSHHISDGTPIYDVLQTVNRRHEQVVAFGVNCVPVNLALEALKHAKTYTRLPLVCYPNSEEIWDSATKTWSGNKPEDRNLTQQVLDWQASGAKLIGGCCRTGPEYVKAVAKACR